MLKWPSAVSLFLFYTYILSLGHLSVKDLDSNLNLNLLPVQNLLQD